MKKCIICNTDKSVLDFNKNKTRKDGLSNVCRECNSECSKKYYYNNSSSHKAKVLERNKIIRKISQEYILNLLKNNHCADCKNSDYRVLEFDHVPGNKKLYNISTMLQSYHSIESIKKEINKCDIVCANCHTIRTIERNPKNYRNTSII